jgi:hypothetical protein
MADMRPKYVEVANSFVSHRKTMLVPRIHSATGRNYELESIWKEAAVAYSRCYASIFLEGLCKNITNDLYCLRPVVCHYIWYS